MASKTVSKGHLIDDMCQVQDGELVDEGGLVYSCTLHQTDLKTNKNKFYIMQLIKKGNSYHLHKRWGRCGEPGRVTPDNYASRITAIGAFHKQYKSKTNNHWGSDFMKKAGKYYRVELSYEELATVPEEKGVIPPSKLESRVQDLIKMISDVQMMKNTLVELDIDTKKMPLGKIKQTQLDKAKKVLDDLEKMLARVSNYDNHSQGSEDSQELEDLQSQVTDLSSMYYTLVPYACGRRKPPSIEKQEMVSKYKNTLDELSNIAIGVNIVNSVKKDENPIDAIYKDVKTNIVALDRDSRMWTEIDTYVKNTHGPTHGAKLEVLDVFDIEQEGRRELFEKENFGVGNRTLLFHGTPTCCVLSIFKRHFHLDPAKLNDVKGVQIAGKMFGLVPSPSGI